MSEETEKLLVSFEVSFGEAPTQGVVTPLCQSLFELCRPIFEDDDAAIRLRLIAHELMENIVKYSVGGGGGLSFGLRTGGAGRFFASVQTRNIPCVENRPDAEERLAALTAARDPLEHYDSIIADSARKPAGSGLGLARIHAETEYRLSHRFEGNTLVIVASGEVWLKKGALP